MNKTADDLNKLRNEIDTIDESIQQLLVKRFEVVTQVAGIKQESDNAIFYRPEREAAMLKKIMKHDCGPLPPSEMAKIFRQIIAAGLAMQQPMRVAFLGPIGTFSQIAAKKHFGASLVDVCCESIADIFAKVLANKAHYGVIPIENTIGGLVETSLHEFIDSPLTICGEVTINIKQTLLRKKNSKQPIHRIYSHEQSLKQCNTWLAENYPQAELVAVTSNALAAKHAAQDDHCAAVAGSQCAQLYDLDIIADNIADHKTNLTRFLVIGHHQPEKSGDDRTSLLIKVHDAPGALEKIINPLAQNNINISMIRSKPANYSGNTYYFFLDLDCYCMDSNFITAKIQIEQGPIQIKILGSYPKAAL